MSFLGVPALHQVPTKLPIKGNLDIYFYFCSRGRPKMAHQKVPLHYATHQKPALHYTLVCDTHCSLLLQNATSSKTEFSLGTRLVM